MTLFLSAHTGAIQFSFAEWGRETTTTTHVLMDISFTTIPLGSAESEVQGGKEP